MSYWRYCKETDGKVTVAAVELTGLVLFAIGNISMLLASAAVLISLLAVNPHPAAFTATAIPVAGLTLFLIAKISVVRSGHPVTWGSGPMSAGHKRCYRAGYLLMAAGAAVGVAIVLPAHTAV